jgi:hypothetical protein
VEIHQSSELFTFVKKNYSMRIFRKSTFKFLESASNPISFYSSTLVEMEYETDWIM